MHVEGIFEDNGGVFLTGYPWFVTKVSRIQAFIFDWDGVFNTGAKGEGHTSGFTETDSMGLNMLRLSYWLTNQKIPFLGVITGQNNQSAVQIAKRERFHSIYSGFLNKETAFNHLLAQTGLEASQVAFVFDDILDVAIADKCGLRVFVKNSGSPLFENFIKENTLADYITAAKGGANAVREFCELVIGVMGNYNETIKERIAFSPLYKEYLGQRNAIETGFWKLDGNAVVKP
jgi:3-deoxy-D-manno-octulosonate 8-phosphate phosphatase (KDO 8-P phosphatase)